jgi:hypothetical protein
MRGADPHVQPVATASDRSPLATPAASPAAAAAATRRAPRPLSPEGLKYYRQFMGLDAADSPYLARAAEARGLNVTDLIIPVRASAYSFFERMVTPPPERPNLDLVAAMNSYFTRTLQNLEREGANDPYAQELIKNLTAMRAALTQRDLRRVGRLPPGQQVQAIERHIQQKAPEALDAAMRNVIVRGWQAIYAPQPGR